MNKETEKLIPKLRFKEFENSGEWEVTKLEKKISLQNKRNKELNVDNVLSVNNKLGFINQSEQFDGREVASFDKSNYKIVNKNDYAYNPSRINVGSIARLKNYENGIVSPMYIVFAIKNLEHKFFDAILESFNFKNLVKNNLSGSVRDSLNFDSLQSFSIPLPPSSDKENKEQQKIASILSSLDELILSQEKKIAELRLYKKGLMQTIFSTESEKVPKLRFPEFSGEWEVQKMGDIGEFYPSLSGKTKEDFDVGNYNFIPYTNIFENIFVDINNLRKVNIYKDENQTKAKKGDIFFTISSETAKEVGMSSVLLDNYENLYVNSFCSIFRLSNLENFDIKFLGFLFRADEFRKDIGNLAQGSTRFNLSKVAVLKLNIHFPTLEEQRKVASLLLSLDEIIGANNEKITNLRKYKKGLMQNLFPTLN